MAEKSPVTLSAHEAISHGRGTGLIHVEEDLAWHMQPQNPKVCSLLQL